MNRTPKRHSEPGPSRLQIISGGQTGVDRAALDAALERNIPCTGWCPRGRRAEDGAIPERYPLSETPSKQYRVRSRWNVRDSDGTLILTRGELAGGTLLTHEIADRSGKPSLIINLHQPVCTATVVDWIATNRISRLNVAGPRESQSPGIYQDAMEFLSRLFDELSA